MIILALSAMVGTSKLMSPYLNDLARRDDTEQLPHLASHLLLATGTPANWGQLANVKPTSLGLGKANARQPYELDIDKVTRLNWENAYSLDYSDLWQAFGIKDVSFQIEIKPLFELSIELISSSTEGNQTTYEFQVNAQRSGMPVQAKLSGYAVVKDFVNKTTALTSASGVGTLVARVPNSLNGTALLLVFAQSTANLNVVSVSANVFSHNSQSPIPDEMFTKLDPLNCAVNATLLYDTAEVLGARIFTFNYNFSLTARAQSAQTIEYALPRFLDASPSVIVITGLNGSTSFAEWVAYPQVPLQIGADFDESTTGSRIVVQNHIVAINSALYEVITKWGGLVADV